MYWQKKMTKGNHRMAKPTASYFELFPFPRCFLSLISKNKVEGATASERPTTYDSTQDTFVMVCSERLQTRQNMGLILVVVLGGPYKLDFRTKKASFMA